MMLMPNAWDRLAYYQAEKSERAAEEERLAVARVRRKQDAGLPLTARKMAILAYSPLGSAAGRGCGG